MLEEVNFEENRPFVVCGAHTHFTYNPQTKEVSCTHGGWSGYLEVNEDGTCKVNVFRNHVINYDSYAFTYADSYCAAVEEGLIDAR